MRNRYLSGVIGFATAMAITLASGVAFAADSSGYKVVDGLTLYYAVVPAEMVRGHPKEHAESTMHGGIPKGMHSHHVMAALFAGESLERVTDADVTATVGELGLAGKQMRLEPFTVADALTYGNYFEFSPLTTYVIDFTIQRPGSSKIVKSRVEYKHQ